MEDIVRHPVLYWAIGGLILFALQVFVAGTGVGYAALVLVFAVATGATLTALGGVGTLPGVCVLVLALQHVLISQIAKLVLGGAADAPLSQPVATMTVYVVGMGGLLSAALLVRRYQGERVFRPLFRAEELESEAPARLLMMTIAAIVLAAARTLIVLAFGVSEEGEAVVGGFLGPLKTMGLLTPFSVALATFYVLKASGGKRSLSVVNAAALLPPLAFGIIGAGRAAIATSLVMYISACLACGYRFGFRHYLALGVCAYVFQFILFPYALMARSIVRTPNLGENARLAASLLTEIVLNPGKYDEERRKDISEESRRRLYYAEPEPTLDRYAVLISVDALVDATMQDGTTGWETIQPGFEMLLPRFLNPDKQVNGTSNALAHRASGLVGRDDRTTQITLGLFADAFSSFGWAGIAVIPFLILFALVVSYQKTVGCGLRRNPYALTFVFSLPWAFSEQPIASATLNIVQAPLIIAVTFGLIRLIAVLLSPQCGPRRSRKIGAPEKGESECASF